MTYRPRLYFAAVTHPLWLTPRVISLWVNSLEPDNLAKKQQGTWRKSIET